MRIVKNTYFSKESNEQDLTVILVCLYLRCFVRKKLELQLY
jgi:hypothetical protein